MSEVVDRYLRLADQFGARVEATPDDAGDNQSPCEDWKARDVVKHVVETQRHLVQRINGAEDEPEPLPEAFDPKQVWKQWKERDARPDAVSHAFKGLQPMDAMIRQNGVFGPKVEPPEGADEQTRFLCSVGRKP